ncbi:MAG: hypothetical protein IJD30_01370 [Clostridia bacterium]|nr:hypothetical protein [Clostridia bacterium]
MKIYEKPMALIEKIEVEDVITASFGYDANTAAAKEFTDDASANVIVFEW